MHCFDGARLVCILDERLGRVIFVNSAIDLSETQLDLPVLGNSTSVFFCLLEAVEYVAESGHALKKRVADDL